MINIRYLFITTLIICMMCFSTACAFNENITDNQTQSSDTIIKDTSFNMNTIKNNSVVTTDTHTVALTNDGTVLATGSNVYNQCDVSNWSDIISIFASNTYTVGITSNNNIEVTNYVTSMKDFDISKWNNIVDIYASDDYILGIQKDGSILIAGNFVDTISNWNDIVNVSRGKYHMAKVNSDGTVVANGENNFSQCDVQDWKNIVQVSATNGYPDVVSFESYSYTVGLKNDGTVIATGYNGNHQCDVQNWKDVIYITTGTAHTIGLLKNGTVLATGNNDYSQCDVSSWNDIVSVYVANHHTVGLKKDGTLVATGDNLDGQCNVDSWKNIKIIS